MKIVDNIISRRQEECYLTNEILSQDTPLVEKRAGRESLLIVPLCRSLVLISLLLLLGLPASAQYFTDARERHSFSPRTVVPLLEFEEVNLSWVGERHLEIAFRLHITGKVVGFDEALHVVPCYEVNGKVISFPVILINDATRNAYYRREVELLDRERFVSERPASVVVLNGKRTDEWVSYRQLLELPEGLSRDGQVMVYQFLQDCCNLVEVGVSNAGAVQAERKPAPEELQQAVQQPQPKPEPAPAKLSEPVITTADVRFYQPSKEVVKERKETHVFRIQFRVGKWNILPDYADNYRELDRVDQAMRPLLRRDDVQLLSASIRGYASPESSEEFNRRLSQQRANSFKNYVRSRYGLSYLTHFPAYGIGEDWDGLRKAIESDDYLPSKWAILSVIDRVYNLDQREDEIKKIAGGYPYRYLLNNLYPPLRRMEMELQYKVREYTTEEAEHLIDSRPQELSQEEIYQVAQRRHKGEKRSRNYGTEYDIAAEYFSEDLIANLNASSAALVRGDYQRAWTYLSRIQYEPQAYLNLGLYYWGIGDGKRALQYLRKATQVPETRSIARDNLARLQRAMDKMDR